MKWRKATPPPPLDYQETMTQANKRLQSAMTSYVWVDCPACGKVPYEREHCVMCSGKGYVEKEDQLIYVEKPLKAKDKQVGGDHYKTMSIQPGEFIRANSIGWYEGNAIKYICRHKQKGGRQDIEKAIHYLQLVLEEYED